MDELFGRAWWMLVLRGATGLLFGMLARPVRTRLVDFTNTIIIATSNIGSQMIQDNLKADAKQLDYPNCAIV
jgi:hypothetical protein